MVDDTTNAMNLASADNLARISVGIDMYDPADWTQDERVQYLKAFATIITTYPTEFNAQTLASAQTILAHPAQDLTTATQDASDEWNTLTYTLSQNFNNVVATPAANIGQAIVNTLNSSAAVLSNAASTAANVSSSLNTASNLSQYLLPAAIVVVFIYLIKDPVRGSQAGENIAGGVRKLLPY